MPGLFKRSASSKARSGQDAEISRREHGSFTIKSAQEQLQSLRKQNVRGEWFVLSTRLEIFNETVVQTLLRESRNQNKHSSHKDFPDLAREVSTKYRSTFAVLVHLDTVHLITKLIATPHSLPVSREFLQLRSLSKYDGDRFFDEQYHFAEACEIDLRIGTALPTVYDDERLILPICAEGKEMSGAFGIVQEVSVYDRSSPQGSKFIKKRLRPEVKRDEYHVELRNLSFLATAKHPNIVPLQCAFTHRGEHNLIFSLAAGGDLSEVLDGVSGVELFNASVPSTDFVFKLCGLASALSTMHVLKTDFYDMIGCHRDLKPSNILISDGKLLLADFGVSRLVESGQTSGSTQPQTRGECIAPECEDMFHEDLPRKRAGRASDVWALGCILLMLSILRLQGVDGVRKFYEDRRTNYGGIIRHRFHRQHSLVDAVEDMLERLENENLDPKLYNSLGQLFRAMLSIDRFQRPSMASVSKFLQRSSLALKSNSVSAKFESFYQLRGSMHIHIESRRYNSWAFAMGFHEFGPTDLMDNDGELSISNFTALSERLEDVALALGEEDVRFKEKASRVQLSNRIDILFSTLTKDQSRKARDRFEQELLNYSSENYLKDLETKTDDRLSQLVAMKRRNLSQVDPIEEHSMSVIETSTWKMQESSGLVGLVELAGGTESGKTLCVAEERPTSTEKDNSLAQQAFRRGLGRLQEVVRLLKEAQRIEDMRVLSCFESGVFSDKHTLKTGLVYQVPSVNNQQHKGLLTLHNILSGACRYRMTLGQRFSLAYMLARSIYELHKVGWLHRRICAGNAIWFHNGDSINPELDVEHVYLVGFAQSRPERDPASTDGNKTTQANAYYLHPAYHVGEEDFQVAFDYHSLGVLLVEIGSSQLLPEVCKAASKDPNRFLRRGLEDPSPILEELAYNMGQTYQAAVTVCLDGTLTQPDSSKIRRFDIESRFKSQVLDPLARSRSINL